MDEEVPPEPSEQRKTSDYEIKWKDKGMETIMRSLEELMMWGEAYPEIRDIRGFEGMNSFTSVMIILHSVKDISVFAELPRLETLWINCHKKVDITPVKEAGQIKSLMVNTEEIR